MPSKPRPSVSLKANGVTKGSSVVTEYSSRMNKKSLSLAMFITVRESYLTANA